MMLCVVNDAELTGGDSMDGVFGVDDEGSGIGPFQGGGMIFRGMPDFEGDIDGCQWLCQEMKSLDREILLISRFRVIPM